MGVRVAFMGLQGACAQSHMLPRELGEQSVRVCLLEEVYNSEAISGMYEEARGDLPAVGFAATEEEAAMQNPSLRVRSVGLRV